MEIKYRHFTPGGSLNLKTAISSGAGVSSMTRILRMDAELSDDAAMAREVLTISLVVGLAFAAMVLVSRL